LLPISCRNCCHSGAYACLRPCCQKCEAGLVRIFHRELEPGHERGQYFRRRRQSQDFNRRRIDREIQGAHHDNDCRKKEEAAAVDEFADIQSNTFFKIIFDEANSPTAKKEAVAKALAFTYDKEEAKQALAEFERFKAYLQSARKDMARQIISLTDTETFSELQGVYSQINDALLDFEQTMTPLTDIIDAIYKLRTNDVTLDIYEEIKRAREYEQKLAAERAEQEAKLEALQAEIGALNRNNATLATDKGFFGGIRKRSLKLIAGNEVTLAEKRLSWMR
jgi:hypothetical protein